MSSGQRDGVVLGLKIAERNESENKTKLDERGRKE
jgi:hypothetical protein